jgi:uncharacterized membrane protein YgdD (TMEM256/DUF423 family)
MNSTTAFRISAAMGFLAVALGAFGAHGLHPLLEQNHKVEVWATAASYHLVHAVVLLVLALRAEGSLGQGKGKSLLAWWCFLAGVVIFSGSLYLLATTNILWLGAITPIGGVSLLVGWAVLVFKGQS